MRRNVPEQQYGEALAGARAGLQSLNGESRPPLQNRVTPFGEIVAIPQRGMFTGNCGIIHDPATKTLTKTLLKRRWATKTWLVSSCEYKGRRRAVMAGRSWTELFFLDEAVALAAGHRPCFLCRREAAERFRIAWVAGKAIPCPSAKEIDIVLHSERIERGRKRVHPISVPMAALPDGAMVVAGRSAFTLHSGQAHRWTTHGYALPKRASPRRWIAHHPRP